jgi:hypothetical protein
LRPKKAKEKRTLAQTPGYNRNDSTSPLQVGGRTLTLHDDGDLKAELDRHTVLGNELRVTVGAFGWVAKVEKLARKTS